MRRLSMWTRTAIAVLVFFVSSTSPTYATDVENAGQPKQAAWLLLQVATETQKGSNGEAADLAERLLGPDAAGSRPHLHRLNIATARSHLWRFLFESSPDEEWAARATSALVAGLRQAKHEGVPESTLAAPFAEHLSFLTRAHADVLMPSWELTQTTLLNALDEDMVVLRGMALHASPSYDDVKPIVTDVLSNPTRRLLSPKAAKKAEDALYEVEKQRVPAYEGLRRMARYRHQPAWGPQRSRTAQQHGWLDWRTALGATCFAAACATVGNLGGADSGGGASLVTQRAVGGGAVAPMLSTKPGGLTNTTAVRVDPDDMCEARLSAGVLATSYAEGFVAPNMRSPTGWTHLGRALQHAAETGESSVLDEVMSWGPDVNQLTEGPAGYMSPLAHLLEHGDVTLLESFLAQAVALGLNPPAPALSRILDQHAPATRLALARELDHHGLHAHLRDATAFALSVLDVGSRWPADPNDPYERPVITWSAPPPGELLSNIPPGALKEGESGARGPSLARVAAYREVFASFEELFAVRFEEVTGSAAIILFEANLKKGTGARATVGYDRRQGYIVTDFGIGTDPRKEAHIHWHETGHVFGFEHPFETPGISDADQSLRASMMNYPGKPTTAREKRTRLRILDALAGVAMVGESPTATVTQVNLAAALDDDITDLKVVEVSAAGLSDRVVIDLRADTLAPTYVERADSNCVAHWIVPEKHSELRVEPGAGENLIVEGLTDELILGHDAGRTQVVITDRGHDHLTFEGFDPTIHDFYLMQPMDFDELTMEFPIGVEVLSGSLSYEDGSSAEFVVGLRSDGTIFVPTINGFKTVSLPDLPMESISTALFTGARLESDWDPVNDHCPGREDVRDQAILNTYLGIGVAVAAIAGCGLAVGGAACCCWYMHQGRHPHDPEWGYGPSAPRPVHSHRPHGHGRRHRRHRHHSRR